MDDLKWFARPEDDVDGAEEGDGELEVVLDVEGTMRFWPDAWREDGLDPC